MININNNYKIRFRNNIILLNIILCLILIYIENASIIKKMYYY